MLPVFDARYGSRMPGLPWLIYIKFVASLRNAGASVSGDAPSDIEGFRRRDTAGLLGGRGDANAPGTSFQLTSQPYPRAGHQQANHRERGD